MGREPCLRPCDATYKVWTAAPGANERRPITCVNWYEAQAFCIWDAGFLPTEAEWNYAAVGGADQRVFPWSVPSNSTNLSCTLSSHDCPNNTCGDGVTGCSANDLIFVGTRPAGDGKFGQADMAGNVREWTLDWYASYGNPCVNCAQLAPSTDRVLRGGGFYSPDQYLRASYRLDISPPAARLYAFGVRCAPEFVPPVSLLLEPEPHPAVVRVATHDERQCVELSEQLLEGAKLHWRTGGCERQGDEVVADVDGSGCREQVC